MYVLQLLIFAGECKIADACSYYYIHASIIDEVVKSRHSRLSGIVVFYNILIKDDSGQAGMTSKEGCPTFYESIIIKYQSLRAQQLVARFA